MSDIKGDARRDRWRSHREARREEFIQAALRALARHGPEFGMEHVAAEAGVTKPVLYRHFTDKADLYVALGQRGTELLFDRLIPARPASAVTNTVADDKELIGNALSTLLGDYMRAFDMDSGAAEPWGHGIVGLVQNVSEWWLERRSMSRDAVVEYLTQIIWAAIDGVVRQHGIVIDPNKPIEVNKVVKLSRRAGNANGTA